MKNISIPKGMRGFILPLSFLGKLRLCTWQILFLLFFISLQAQAQQSDLLTLNMKNVTLKQFVEAVQTQSGYSFLYKDNQLKPNQRIKYIIKVVPVITIIPAKRNRLTFLRLLCDIKVVSRIIRVAKGMVAR